MDNRKRALEDVVSVEAWHLKFAPNRRTVDLHADLTFKEGRIGAETESKVTFRLSVIRAEVVVLKPANEPCEIPQDSVFRVGHAGSADVESEWQEGGELAATIAPGLSASGRMSASKKQHVTSRNVSPFSVIHSMNDGSHTWEIEAAQLLKGVDPDGMLRGKPWDPIGRPLLKVTDIRRDPDKGIPPQLRIIVRCRREDLQIKDITYKKKPKGIWPRDKTVAAEQVIRQRLIGIWLDVPDDFSQDFSTITLADISVENSDDTLAGSDS